MDKGVELTVPQIEVIMGALDQLFLNEVRSAVRDAVLAVVSADSEDEIKQKLDEQSKAVEERAKDFAPVMEEIILIKARLIEYKRQLLTEEAKDSPMAKFVESIN